MAKSFVSVISKTPEISDLPPEIGPLETPGAEYTILSKTIAILLFWVYAFPVNSSQALAPCPFICIETAGFPNWSKVSLASVTTPPPIAAILSLFPFNAYSSTASMSFPSLSLMVVGFPQTNLA